VTPQARRPCLRIFLEAATVSLVNSKTPGFFAAAVPQFVDLHTPILPRLATLIAIDADVAAFFLERYCTRMHKPTPSLSKHALQQLEVHGWPGNVRELENLVEKMVNLNEGDCIADVSPFLRSTMNAQPGSDTRNVSRHEPVSLQEAERIAIENALEACRFKVTTCAKLLRVSKPALYAKMKRHGIRIERSLRHPS